MKDDNYKKMAVDYLTTTTQTLINSYSTVYDLAKDKENRDAVFVKELANLLLPITAILEVYARDEYIHHGYALEKLNSLELLVNQHIKYWELKGEQNETQFQTTK